MKVIFQSRIYRSDLKNNPDLLYLFGDNDLRMGYGGQAREMRGESNALGIRTKLLPTMEKEAFMNDEDFKRFVDMIRFDIATMNHIMTKHNYFGIVVPSDGLGTGLSELPQRAPKVYDSLNTMLAINLNMNVKDFPWMMESRSE